jgi:hypothetical protein
MEMKMTLPKIVMTKKVDGLNNKAFEVSLIRRKAGWDGHRNAPEAWFVKTEDLHPTDQRWFHKVFNDSHTALEAYCNVE